MEFIGDDDKERPKSSDNKEDEVEAEDEEELDAYDETLNLVNHMFVFSSGFIILVNSQHIMLLLYFVLFHVFYLRKKEKHQKGT